MRSRYMFLFLFLFGSLIIFAGLKHEERVSKAKLKCNDDGGFFIKGLGSNGMDTVCVPRNYSCGRENNHN